MKKVLIIIFVLLTIPSVCASFSGNPWTGAGESSFSGTLTQILNTAGYAISGDEDDEGIYIHTDGSAGINTNDFDGTPAVGTVIIKASSNDGSTNALVIRDSDEANVLTVNSDGDILVNGAPGTGTGEIQVLDSIDIWNSTGAFRTNLEQSSTSFTVQNTNHGAINLRSGSGVGNVQISIDGETGDGEQIRFSLDNEIWAQMYDGSENMFGIGTIDFDGTPAVGTVIVKASTNDGSTNALVLRDSDEANVLTVDSDGFILSAGIKNIVQSSTDTLTAQECRGTIINNYGQLAENTQTLPTATEGLNGTVVIGTSGAGAFHLKAGASDKIYLDGTALDDGDKVSIATPGVGDNFTFYTFQTGASAWDWIVISGSQGTLTDGGA